MTENKGDLISRKALKKDIEHLHSVYAENKDWFYTDVLYHIDNAPTVEPERPQGDLISRSALKEQFTKAGKDYNHECVIEMLSALATIDNAPTVEEIEKPFITECRNTAIEKGLPLYFVYYEETGVFEVYKTDTKELFEKRHCVKHIKDYEFQQLANLYLDEYSNWIDGANNG